MSDLRMYHNRFWYTVVFASLTICRAADLGVAPAYLRPDPFGTIVPSDSAGNAQPAYQIARWRPKLTIREAVVRTVDFLRADPWVIERR